MLQDPNLTNDLSDANGSISIEIRRKDIPSDESLQLKGMGSGALHKDILLDNVRDAQGNPAAGNWACQLILRAQSLGMSAPFDASGSVVIDAAQHRDQALQCVQRVWDDTHISPRSCPSAGAKLCTYHRWFSRPDPQVPEPYFELPLSKRSMGQLFRFRLSSHSLPIEQGRRAKLPRAMRVCPLCPGHHVGDERHLVLSAQHCNIFGSIMPAYFPMHIPR